MLVEPQTPRADASMIPRHRVHLAERCVPVGAGPAAPREAQVELVRDGNSIRTIRITCGCGETIVLDCEYDGRPVAP